MISCTLNQCARSRTHFSHSANGPLKCNRLHLIWVSEFGESSKGGQRPKIRAESAADIVPMRVDLWGRVQIKRSRTSLDVLCRGGAVGDSLCPGEYRRRRVHLEMPRLFHHDSAFSVPM